MKNIRIETNLDQETGANFKILNNNLIIWLNQDLDHHLAVTLRQKADKLIEKGNIKNIIFDFADSNFMDSSGIGLIMGRYKRVIFTGGKVYVTNVNESVNRIFQLSGLYKIIDKYNTVEDALGTC